MRKNFVGEHSWGFWWVQRKDAYTFSCNIGYKSWVRFYFYFSLPTRKLRKTDFFRTKNPACFLKYKVTGAKTLVNKLNTFPCQPTQRRGTTAGGPETTFIFSKWKEETNFYPERGMSFVHQEQSQNPRQLLEFHLPAGGGSFYIT